MHPYLGRITASALGHVRSQGRISPCARSSRHPSHVDFFAGDHPRTLNTPQPCWQAVSFLQTPDESRTSPRRQCAFQRYRTLGSRLRPSASSVASSPAAASSSAALRMPMPLRRVFAARFSALSRRSRRSLRRRRRCCRLLLPAADAGGDDADEEEHWRGCCRRRRHR